jgi:hypothetical protein
MKKLVAVMLLGIALLGTISAQDLKSARLQGKVHTREEETWELTLKFGEYVKNKLTDKETYIYDDKGNLTEWASYNADRSVDLKGIYTYDDKGNKTEWALYNADGSLNKKDIFTYDDKGNETEWTWYNADGSLFRKVINTYDARGNNTEMASYNADGSLSGKEIYTYEYDKFGNWTKKITSAEVSKFGKVYLEPQEVTIRTITYYP